MKIFRNQKRKRIVIAGTAITVFILAFSAPADKYFDIARNLDIFASLFKEVNGYYVDEVDPARLVAIGIEAMTESLDPYSVFIPEEEASDFRTLTTGQYAGIGVLVARINGETFITMVDERYPAYKAGIKIGDKIVEVDGQKLSLVSQGEISKSLKGEIEKEVKIKVERYGQPGQLEFKIKRENIKINNVLYFGLVDDNVGYIRLSDFMNDAGKEVASALDSLKKAGAQSLILDIRGNPGGLLNEAIAVCNVFVEKGKEVVSTKGQVAEWNRSYVTPADPKDTQIPIAVLIDQRSASAAEIVSGVIQDYDRGILVGKKSFGKGLVQATRSLAYNTQLKITTAKYYTPSGRCIQAIDYSHKNEDGSTVKIPDSLKIAFKTAKGRVVYDGGGIDPDFEIESQPVASITRELVSNGFIFNYATHYYYNHAEIKNPDHFEFSDSDYKNFLEWMNKKKFQYETMAESDLREVEETASKEKYYDAIRDKIANLKSELNKEKQNDFTTFKEEIKRFIAQEIIARYYLEKGQLKYSLRDDQGVQEAVKLLHDQSKYQRILRAGN